MIFLSSSCVSGGTIIEKLEILGKITKNIELSGGSLFEEEILEKLLIEKGKGFNFLLHGYFPPPKKGMLLNFADSSKETQAFISHSVFLCKALKIPYYSVHAGFKKDYTIDKEKLFGGSKNFYLSGIEKNINWFCDSFPDMELAVENLFPVGNDISTCFCMHHEDIVNFLNRFKKIKLLLDLGHLQVSGKLLDFDIRKSAQILLKEFSDRVIEIHLSENDGFDDDHNIPQKYGFQYNFVNENLELIVRNRINLTIEARKSSMESIEECFNSFHNLIF